MSNWCQHQFQIDLGNPFNSLVEFIPLMTSTILASIYSVNEIQETSNPRTSLPTPSVTLCLESTASHILSSCMTFYWVQLPDSANDWRQVCWLTLFFKDLGFWTQDWQYQGSGGNQKSQNESVHQKGMKINSTRSTVDFVLHDTPQPWTTSTLRMGWRWEDGWFEGLEHEELRRPGFGLAPEHNRFWLFLQKYFKKIIHLLPYIQWHESTLYPHFYSDCPLESSCLFV